MYCGDDVSSAVIDIGHEETRAGYSGEDVPRSMIPSLLGVLEGDAAKMPRKPTPVAEEGDAEMADEEAKALPSVRYICG